MGDSKHAWRSQDGDAAEAWLANFRSLAQTPGGLPRPLSFDSLGLHIMEVQLKPCVWEVSFEDVFVSPNKGDLS
jgi:hypothetical protein